MAVLLIDHDVNLVASVSDRMLALDFGRVVAQGPPNEVRNAPAVMASYLGIEVEAALESEEGVGVPAGPALRAATGESGAGL